MIFYWFFYYFVEIDIFDVDRCPRAIRDRKREPKGSQMGAKMASKAVKNDIFFVMDFGCDFLDRSGASWDDLGAILGPLKVPRDPENPAT